MTAVAPLRLAGTPSHGVVGTPAVVCTTSHESWLADSNLFHRAVTGVRVTIASVGVCTAETVDVFTAVAIWGSTVGAVAAPRVPVIRSTLVSAVVGTRCYRAYCALPNHEVMSRSTTPLSGTHVAVGTHSGRVDWPFTAGVTGSVESRTVPTVRTSATAVTSANSHCIASADCEFVSAVVKRCWFSVAWLLGIFTCWVAYWRLVSLLLFVWLVY